MSADVDDVALASQKLQLAFAVHHGNPALVFDGSPASFIQQVDIGGAGNVVIGARLSKHPQCADFTIRHRGSRIIADFDLDAVVDLVPRAVVTAGIPDEADFGCPVVADEPHVRQHFS